MLIRPKDYLVIDNKLFFAVVSDKVENNKVLTILRYIKHDDGMKKLDSKQAYEIISTSYPEYKLQSQLLDIDLHGILIDSSYKYLKPEQTVSKLLKMKQPDKKQNDAITFLTILKDSGICSSCLGITGSLMLGTHNNKSDVDIVVYGRDNFFKVRECVKNNIASGNLDLLDKNAWEDSWRRRSCELDFEDYYIHEKRKFNKCLSGTSKVDISMIPFEDEKKPDHFPYKKLMREKIIAKVVDDTYSYDLPARYELDNKEIKEVVTYTATYTGQAKKGENIEAAGYIELDNQGNKRLLVGTSREAFGEYIKVINCQKERESL